MGTPGDVCFPLKPAVESGSAVRRQWVMTRAAAMPQVDLFIPKRNSERGRTRAAFAAKKAPIILCVDNIPISLGV
jgi:hypothetical protein